MVDARKQKSAAVFCLMKELLNIDCLLLKACILKNVSSIDEREHRNSHPFTPDLTSGLKDLLSIDLFSVYLLSHVDTVICYVKVDFALPDYVYYIEEFVILRFVTCISRFYSIHFTVTFSGTQGIVCYIEDFIK